MKRIFSLIFFVCLPLASWAVAPEDYYNAGMDLLDKQHDYEKAVQYFRAAIDERPDYWQAYQGIGEAYYQAANRTEAIVAIEQSLRLHPNNPSLREFLAKIKKSSPWVVAGGLRDWLPMISIILSLLTLGWTIYWAYRWGSKGNGQPPHV